MLSPIKTKYTLVLFALFLQLGNTYAQHSKNIELALNNINCTLDSGYFSKEFRVGQFQTLIRKSIFDKNTGKLAEELIVTSDSSIYYVQYDAALNVTGMGVYSSTQDKRKGVKMISIPDIANDPNGNKGLSKDWSCEGGCILPVEKNGLWIEPSVVNNQNLTGIGFYENGTRTGRWEFGDGISLNMNDQVAIRTNLMKEYKHDQNEKAESINQGKNEETNLLLGTWFIEETNTKGVFYLNKYPFELYFQTFVNFCTTSSCLDNAQILVAHGSMAKFSQWEIRNHTLILKTDQKSVRYKVSDLTKNSCMLTALK